MTNPGYHHDDLKSELIREGLHLLDQEGYAGFSMRKVARACHVSQTAPYRHFKNKDELIAAIVTAAIEDFNKHLADAVTEHPGDSARQLKSMGLAYIRFFSENPEYLHMLFSSDLFKSMGAPDCPEDTEDRDHPFSTFYQAIENYMAVSDQHPLSTEEMVLYCWGLVHGISVLLSSMERLHFQSDPIRLAENILENDAYLK